MDWKREDLQKRLERLYYRIERISENFNRLKNIEFQDFM